jgi:diguanylate cyclase (GGDEF)-like protein/PAS domain S-box-containing protein
VADNVLPPLPTRLRTRLLDPMLIPTMIIVALTFEVGHLLGVIANVPAWALVGVLAGGMVVACTADALWGAAVQGWRLWTKMAVQLGAITFVMYTIGWGPTLGIGLAFGAIESLRVAGSRAVVPGITLSAVALGVGEVAIATGVAPSLVSSPLVHGLALLSALGVGLTIREFDRTIASAEQAKEEVRQREERFKALVQNAADIIMVVGGDSRVGYLSPAFESLLGYSLDQTVGSESLELVHPDDAELLRVSLAHMESASTRHAIEIRLLHADGAWRWFDVTVSDLREDANVAGWVANMRDITERKRSEVALREAQEAFRHAFDDAPIGMVMTDVSGTVLRANHSLAALLGRDRDDLVGIGMLDLTVPDDRATSERLRLQLCAGEIQSYQQEMRYFRSDATIVWASLSVSAIRDEDGRPTTLIGQLEDITERKTLGDRLAYQAAHDPMTGLANRATFTDEVSHALETATSGGQRVAVLFIDLDHFKLVNDGLGHAAGDELLMTVAHRLRSALRPHDVVARFGGDEFVVLCRDVPSLAAAMDVAQRVNSALEMPVILIEGEVFVSASIGIAFSSEDDNAETLLQHADAAMYRAKNDGRARIQVFDADHDGAAVTMLRTGNELHRAIERNELELHYQPITELRSGRVIGFEALLRWNHRVRGLLQPSEFIHLAEATGLIVPVGAWVLESACEQVAYWQTQRRPEHRTTPLGVNVNLSPRQIADPSLTKTVQAVLDRTGIAPEAVWLEITENSLMDDTVAVMATLNQLRELGVHLCIDDFGTGFSSLSYLKRLPVETLKIDRTFVDGLGTEPEDSSIVEAIVTLAHALDMTAIAEGLETPAQLDALRTLGCDFAQGFLLGAPRAIAEVGDHPADDLTAWQAPPRGRVAG